MIESRLALFPCFQQILKERPRVIASQIQHAWDMPENTFGGAYAKFMGDRNFSPDEELAYVAQRAREVFR
jgi:ubiquinone biosynthesis protein COQ4